MRAPARSNIVMPCARALAIVAATVTSGVQAADLVVNGTTNTISTSENFDNAYIGQTADGGLEIVSGGNLAITTNSYIATQAGVAGAATVTDGGAWSSFRMAVGQFGSGTLIVENGADVSVGAGALTVGTNAGSTGLLDVTGSGSTLTTTSSITIGQSGNGTLNLSDGASLTSGGTFGLGAVAGSLGTATITGTGTTLTGVGIVQVGGRGTGILYLLDGADITSANASVGSSSGSVASSGTATVSGAGSTWTNTGSDFQIGFGAASGTLNIENGGTVTTTSAMSLGWNNVILPGTVNVSGLGSSLDVGSILTIGRGGTGTLSILNGGVVTSGEGRIGDLTGSFGTANVTGAGAVWDLSDEYLYVGNNGNGTLTVSEGGSVTDVYAVLVGYNDEDAVGVVTITGAGSELISRSDAYIGGDGQGTVNVLNGARFETGGAYVAYDVAGQGTINVSGAGSEWVDDGDVYLGYAGVGLLNISAGGSVEFDEAYLGYNGSDARGEVTVTGAGSQFTINNSAYIGYEADGIVLVSNGGLFTTNSTTYLGEGGVGAATVTGAGSRWQANDDIEIGVYRASGGYPDGRGDVVVAAGGVLEATGDINVALNSVEPVPGTLTVTGAGSSVTAANLNIGAGGLGTATLANGGRITAGAVTIATGGAQAEGTLIFGAAAGEAPVAPGTLDAATIFFGDGTGQMIFNHTGSLNFSAALSSFTGTPTIDVLAGTTSFTGNANGFDGTMNIEGGTAFINANFGGTQVNVSGSGTLGGSDWVGALNVMAGGTVAPGNSIGTLTVAADAIFAPGSFFAVEVAGAQSDLLHVGGVATINGGTVHVSGGAPTLSQYTILETEFGLTGTFDGLDTTSAFILYSLDYDLNNVYLVVDGFNALTTAARTPNQYAVANALDKFPAGNPLYSAIIGGSVADAQQAFNALSGEIHASVGTALADDSRYVREAITGRLIQAYYGGAGAGGGQPIVLAAAAPTDVATIDASSRMSLGAGYGAAREAPAGGHNLAYWSRAFGAWGQYDTNGNAATTDRNLGGFITGVDGDLGGGWRAGLATGYLHTGLSADERLSSASINSYVLGGYAGGALGHGFALRSGGTWTWNDVDSARSVVFPGFFEAENANYNGNVGQLFAELAYPLVTHGGVVEPFAGLAYVHVGTGGFTESGPVAGLTSGGLDMSLGYGTLGARTGTTVVWGGTTVIPHASAAWQYAFGDTTPQQALAFASTGIGMGIGGVPLAQSSALVEVGADALIGPEATLGLSYIGQYSGNFTDSGLRGRFNWKF